MHLRASWVVQQYINENEMRRAFALYFLLIIITLSMSASDLDQIKLSRKQDDTIHQDLLIKLFQSIEFFFTLL